MFVHNPTIIQCREVVATKPEFREINKGTYTIFDYSVALENTFDCPVSREMRGIAFDTETGQIVSRPFHKFFNLNEKEETHESGLDFSQEHIIMEKLDGSMIRPIKSGSSFVWGTRAGETDVSQKVVQFLKQSELTHCYERFVHASIAEGLTPTFEFCSRAQRIVIDYPTPQLVLTSIRINDSGKYLDQKYFDSIVRECGHGIPVIKTIPSTTSGDFGTFKENIKNLKDEEGIVIRFQSGLTIKMKAEDYVLKHKALDGLRFEKDVVKMHLEGLIDDVYQIIPVDRAEQIKAHLKEFDSCISTTHDQIVSIYDTIKHIEKQKEFASEATKYPFSSYLFSARNDKNIFDCLIEAGKKSTSTQAKLVEFRKFINFTSDYYA